MTQQRHQWWEQPEKVLEENHTCVVVGVRQAGQCADHVEEWLRELVSLCRTLELEVRGTFIQRLAAPHPATYIGKGKAQEIAVFVREQGVGFVVFDDELTPSQIKNLEELIGVPVLDRADIILLIFWKHARSAQAKLQVELARLEHMLPRLKRMWTHLERQTGGIGVRGGAGEREIEKDRRIIGRRIAYLRRRLAEIARQSEERRKHRGELVRIALVGYTNAGKTTLMNLLTKEHLRAEDKLFATLDTVVRRTVIEGVPVLISDTVGFIRKLPPQLVAAFWNTLAEAREADILLHVVDISNPWWGEQVKEVLRTLSGLKITAKPTITVFNKVDLLQKMDGTPVIAEHLRPFVFISALSGEGISQLKELLLKEAIKIYRERYPHIVPQIWAHGTSWGT